MKKHYISLFLVVLVIGLLLTGCQHAGQVKNQNHNYLTQDMKLNDALAADVQKIMLKIFPPARVKLAVTGLNNSTMEIDYFGAALIERLRKSGYAMFETEQKNLTSTDVEVLPSDRIQLFYIVDYIVEDANIIRVTLTIGDDILTRGYSVASGKINALGEWTHSKRN